MDFFHKNKEEIASRAGDGMTPEPLTSSTFAVNLTLQSQQLGWHGLELYMRLLHHS